jgi:CHAT domain-containing protein
MDYAVSSYIPTITTLIEKKESLTSPNSLFLVSQSKAPGLSEIPGADDETNTLSNMMRKQGIPHYQLSGPTATVQNVKKNIGSYGVIHLACHGRQIAGKPLESGFYLLDQDTPNGEPQRGCLRLSEIIKENLPNADLAFLSACQTSTGDQTLSDEAVHLAAGMLAAGYRSVVGTMWSIQDQYGQLVAEEFYKNLLERGIVDGVPRLDGSQAAYALHHAVKCLRKEVGDGAHGLSIWLPYVHFGV